MNRKNHILLFVSLFLFSCKPGSFDKEGNELQGCIVSVVDSVFQVSSEAETASPNDLRQLVFYGYDKARSLLNLTIHTMPNGNISFSIKNEYCNGQLYHREIFSADQYLEIQSLRKVMPFKFEYSLLIYDFENSERDFRIESVKDARTAMSTISEGTLVVERDIFPRRKFVFKDISRYCGNERECYIYDLSGNVIQKKSSSDSYPYVFLEKSIYNKKKWLMVYTTESLKKNGEKHKYSYKYPEIDKQGNWTKQVCYVNGEADYVVHRTIKYCP